MSFEINPNMNQRNVSNANKAQAMDNEGRGSSAGGGGFSGSAFGEPELEGNDDSLELSTSKTDIDEEMQENLGTLWNTIVTFIKRVIYKILKSIS